MVGGLWSVVTAAGKTATEGNMSRNYAVIDADGHVLEPFTLWNDYMDPQ